MSRSYLMSRSYMTFTLSSQAFCFFIHITITYMSWHSPVQCLPTPSSLVRGDLYRLRCLVFFNKCLPCWVKNFSRKQFEIIFFFFPKKIGSGISCKLSPEETICKKFKNLFSEKNKKNIINLTSAELAQRVVMIKKLKDCPMIVPLPSWSQVNAKTANILVISK